MSDSLGDRMKGYESAYRMVMPRRLPIILRLDGRAFHTWTRDLDRPFSKLFCDAMDKVARTVCEDAQGASIAYVQSDEISILLHNYRSLESSPWFDNQIQKIVSVVASIASTTMTVESPSLFGSIKGSSFDCRTFVLPEAEVCNYFLWRQQDASRNSIQMLAQSLYPQSELHQKNTSVLQEMTFQKGHNWNDLPTSQRRGRCLQRVAYDVDGVIRNRWEVDSEIPIFSQDRDYIEKHLRTPEPTETS